MIAFIKVKLRGPRSIETKLLRLAYELADDARRVKADYPEQDSLANGLSAVSSQLGKMSRSIGRGE